MPHLPIPIASPRRHGRIALNPGRLRPAIYVVRDGRVASISLWQMYGGRYQLPAIIEGKHSLGIWADHVDAWKPKLRPNTLLVRYEEMVGDMPKVLGDIGRFLGRNILSEQIPDRASSARVDGLVVRDKRASSYVLSGDTLALFNQINERMMKEMGYST